MTAISLPEGTDSIIEDSAVQAGSIDETPGFGATGETNMKEPATSGPSVSSTSGSDRRFDEDDAYYPTGASDADAVKGAYNDAKTPPTVDDAKAAIGDAKAKIGEAASGLKGQAGDKAREYALLGKDRASEALHNVAKLIDDAAGTVDDKVGAQYGDYARQASGFVKNFAAGIDDKDIDELFAQGRELVRKSPGVAIGIAAALGFVMTRIVKAGLEPASAPTSDDYVSPPRAGYPGGPVS